VIDESSDDQPAAASSSSQLRLSFIESTEHLPVEPGPGVGHAGWDYELFLGNWLARHLDHSDVRASIASDLSEALRSIFDSDDRILSEGIRFAAFYSLAMHQWNRGDFSGHETHIGNYAQYFGDDTLHPLIFHRRAMLHLNRAKIASNDADATHEAKWALQHSTRCVSELGLHDLPGVVNIYVSVATLIRERDLLDYSSHFGDEVELDAIERSEQAIMNLQHRGRISEFPRIAVSTALLCALQGDFGNARRLVGIAQSNGFVPKPEDEFSLGKIEFLSLASRNEDQLSDIRDSVSEVSSELRTEMRRHRGEMLSLLGLIGAVVAFLSVGTNIALKGTDGKQLALLFLLIGAIILLVFSGFWAMVHTTDDKISDRTLTNLVQRIDPFSWSTSTRIMMMSALVAALAIILLVFVVEPVGALVPVQEMRG